MQFWYCMIIAIYKIPILIVACSSMYVLVEIYLFCWLSITKLPKHKGLGICMLAQSKIQSIARFYLMCCFFSFQIHMVPVCICFPNLRFSLYGIIMCMYSQLVQLNTKAAWIHSSTHILAISHIIIICIPVFSHDVQVSVILSFQDPLLLRLQHLSPAAARELLSAE